MKYCAVISYMQNIYITTTYKMMHFAPAYSYKCFISNTKSWVSSCELSRRDAFACSSVFHSHFEANLRLLTDKTFVVVKASSYSLKEMCCHIHKSYIYTAWLNTNARSPSSHQLFTDVCKRKACYLSLTDEWMLSTT